MSMAPRPRLLQAIAFLRACESIPHWSYIRKIARANLSPNTGIELRTLCIDRGYLTSELKLTQAGRELLFSYDYLCKKFEEEK